MLVKIKTKTKNPLLSRPPLSICLSPFLCTRVLKWSVFHAFPVVGQTISALAASPDKNTLLNLLIRY